MTIDYRQYYWKKFNESKRLQQMSSFFGNRENYFAQKHKRRTRWVWLGSTVITGGFCFFAYIKSKYAKIYCKQNEPLKYQSTIDKSRDILKRLKDEVGTPGIVIGVSINGRSIWQEGLGYADVENRVPCTKDTVMRIASISKSLTMAALAKLWENGKLDLDKPVKKYVPFFPEKTYEGKKVDITCRHLVSHLSGIRHYDKNVLKNNSEKSDLKSKKEEYNEKKSAKEKDENDKKNGNNAQKSEFEFKEYFIKEKYDSVKASLDLFKDDPLVHKPGTKFLYTTHGWTLLSAVVEALVEKPFTTYMCQLFKDFGMANTFLDTNDAIIYHRSRYYCKDKKGRLQNSPYVDNSYKWAGGGFLSTVGDLLKFGNIMLYSLQYKRNDSENECKNDFIQSAESEKEGVDAHDINLLNAKTDSSNEIVIPSCTITKNDEITRCDIPGYLKDTTVKMIWLPVENTTPNWDVGMSYGMGWGIVSRKQDYGYCREANFHVSHTGGAIGASSVLLILPQPCKNTEVVDCRWDCPPQGVVVTIITNLQSVGLMKTAVKIAKLFQEECYDN